MPDMEGPLIEAATRYLKERYGEDTLSMTVTANAVEKGDGVLAVDCTVRFGGTTSDWRKKFTFAGGVVTTMSARMR
jgi:adenine/guanine phosphoribosyltransferase-like PRPP-binding protein